MHCNCERGSNVIHVSIVACRTEPAGFGTMGQATRKGPMGWPRPLLMMRHCAVPASALPLRASAGPSARPIRLAELLFLSHPAAAPLDLTSVLFALCGVRSPIHSLHNPPTVLSVHNLLQSHFCITFV
jgi:hypothetical protein